MSEGPKRRCEHRMGVWKCMFVTGHAGDHGAIDRRMGVIADWRMSVIADWQMHYCGFTPISMADPAQMALVGQMDERRWNTRHGGER